MIGRKFLEITKSQMIKEKFPLEKYLTFKNDNVREVARFLTSLQLFYNDKPLQFKIIDLLEHDFGCYFHLDLCTDEEIVGDLNLAIIIKDIYWTFITQSQEYHTVEKKLDRLKSFKLRIIKELMNVNGLSCSAD